VLLYACNSQSKRSVLQPGRHQSSFLPSVSTLVSQIPKISRINQEFMIITTPSQPSAYEAQRTNSSRWLTMGTTAPCSIGRASTGVRRLGNKLGNSVCSAVPSVCGSPAIAEPARPPRVEADVLVVMVGGMCACRTLMLASLPSGPEGRYSRSGMLRNWPGGGRSEFWMRT